MRPTNSLRAVRPAGAFQDDGKTNSSAGRRQPLSVTTPLGRVTFWADDQATQAMMRVVIAMTTLEFEQHIDQARTYQEQIDFVSNLWRAIGYVYRNADASPICDPSLRSYVGSTISQNLMPPWATQGGYRATGIGVAASMRDTWLRVGDIDTTGLSVDQQLYELPFFIAGDGSIVLSRCAPPSNTGCFADRFVSADRTPQNPSRINWKTFCYGAPRGLLASGQAIFYVRLYDMFLLARKIAGPTMHRSTLDLCKDVGAQWATLSTRLIPQPSASGGGIAQAPPIAFDAMARPRWIAPSPHASDAIVDAPSPPSLSVSVPLDFAYAGGAPTATTQIPSTTPGTTTPANSTGPTAAPRATIDQGALLDAARRLPSLRGPASSPARSGASSSPSATPPATRADDPPMGSSWAPWQPVESPTPAVATTTPGSSTTPVAPESIVISKRVATVAAVAAGGTLLVLAARALWR